MERKEPTRCKCTVHFESAWKINGQRSQVKLITLFTQTYLVMQTAIRLKLHTALHFWGLPCPHDRKTRRMAQIVFGVSLPEDISPKQKQMSFFLIRHRQTCRSRGVQRRSMQP